MTKWILPTLVLFMVCWGSATAQAPGSEAALDRIAIELRTIRQLAEKQMIQTAQVELIRAKVLRLADLQRRLDLLIDERESETRVMQTLSQTRNTAAAEDRSGIDQTIQDSNARLMDVARREAAARAEAQAAEQTLAGYWTAVSATEQSGRNRAQ